MNAKQAFVPKNRRPKFDLTLKIVDLNNVPLICGTSYVRWHLPSSSSAEHRGHTARPRIRDHKAVYDYHKILPVRLTIERTGMLRECEVHFEVLQEYSEGGRGGRVMLGTVSVNLAEYADDGSPERKRGDGEGDDGEREAEGGGSDDDVVMRRYLMQDSKINSTLKIGIRMRQLEGDTSFTSPPLKTAMVFGGIAGVLSAQEAAGDNLDDKGGHIPRMANRTRELSEMQDVYRQTLAASWSRAPDDMPPDKLIEDLFEGGDGGAMLPPSSGPHSHPPPPPPPPAITMSRHGSPRQDDELGDGLSVSDTDSKRATSRRHRFLSPETARRGRDHHTLKATDQNDDDSNSNGINNPRIRPRRPPTLTSASNLDSPSHHSSPSSSSMPAASVSTISGRQSIEQQMHHMDKDNGRARRKGLAGGVAELDVREDLASWQVRPIV